MIITRRKYKTDKRARGKTFFQYPDALHELNRAMATECAEIALGSAGQAAY
jgi:hypothetical protein